MKKKITAKTFIRALTVTLIILFTVMGAYFISNKPSPDLEDYSNEITAKEECFSSRAMDLARLNPHSRQLLDINRNLCRLKVCQQDYSAAVKYVPDLFEMASDAGLNNWQKSNLYLFGGNVYRDCAKFDQAQESYQKSLSEIATLAPPDKSNINTDENEGKTAIDLNNLGVVYYLLGKSGASKEECRKNYSAAKNYFEQATTLINKNQNICMSKTIQNNIDECLIELKFLD